MSHTEQPAELLFEHHMSDAEALMWNVEKDPWMNPSGATIAIVDRPINADEFRHRMRYAVSRIPRLRQRVSPSLGRMSPPSWVPDHEFDFDFHVRHLSLPKPGTLEQLHALGARLLEDPFDRTRPLWLFVIIDGLNDGRGALFMKIHHTISDGKGMVQLAELYMDPRRDAPLPPAIDLRALIESETRPVDEAEEKTGPDLSGSLTQAANSSLGHLIRRQVGMARRVAGEVALWSSDLTRVQDATSGLVHEVKQAIDQLGGSNDGSSGSSLWKQRSRQRRLEALRLPLAEVKSAGKSLGGSINDFFVTGAVNGALRYHEKRNIAVESLNVSFVVSTRTDATTGTNAFTPVKVSFPGIAMSPSERFTIVSALIAKERSGVQGAGLVADLARVANLLPTSTVTRFARAQAAKLDFATSNLPAAPFPMYIAGSLLLELVTLGPVAGTAFNLTAMSYNGSLDMGMHIDPAAVDDPADLKRCLVEAYDELRGAAGGSTKAVGTRAAAPKTSRASARNSSAKTTKGTTVKRTTVKGTTAKESTVRQGAPTKRTPVGKSAGKSAK